MAKTDSWIGSQGADWGAAAANWSTGLPTPNSNVRVNTPQILTITFSGSDGYIVNSLTVGSDFFRMTGGSLTIETTASFAKGFTQTGGSFTAAGAVTVGGTALLVGGDAEGAAVFALKGGTMLGNYTIGGSVVLNNSGTVEETGRISLGDQTGTNATINNDKGAAFDIAGDFGISAGAATARLVNLAGATLEKAGGIGTSVIGVTTTDNGAIIVDTGEIEFVSASNNFAGVIAGDGEFWLGGGSQDLIAKTASITAAAFAITDTGTVVTLARSLAYAGSFSLLRSATLDLGGFALTLSGDGDLESASIDGKGSLVTVKNSATTAGQLTLGGPIGWRNSGTVNEVNALFLGDSSTNAATFTNEKGGVYAFTTDSGIAIGAAPASKFVNLAGATLEKLGGAGGVSVVSTNVTDSGAIVIDIGAIEFEGSSNSFAGTVSGAGELVFGRGSQSLIAKGASITTATLNITDSGTVVTLGENLDYAGAFNLLSGATLDPGGHILTLSREGALEAAVAGSGTVSTARGSMTIVGQATLAGAVEWKNSGLVNEFQTLVIGSTSSDTAAFLNEPGGDYRFIGDVGITLESASLVAGFYNLAAATLEKTGGTGTTIIGADLLDSGAIVVRTGAIECEGANDVLAGGISGAGEFDLRAASTTMVADGAAIGTAIFGIIDNGTLVTLSEDLSLARAFLLEQQSALDLGGFTLTLSGADTFGAGPVIDGDGTLVTMPGSRVSLSSVILGGAVAWQNSGAVNASGTLTVGDAGPDAATFVNESGGVYRFVNDSGIDAGAVAGTSFINQAGATLAKTGGIGDSIVAVALTNNGKVNVDTGALEFAGSVGGAGSFAVEPGAMLQFDDKVATGVSVVFAGRTGGELILLDSPGFGASIHGFGGTATDAIDLGDIAFSAAGFKLGYSGNTTKGVLTVTDGTDTAKLTLFGNYTKASFHASSDGARGTLIVDPPHQGSALAFGH